MYCKRLSLMMTCLGVLFVQEVAAGTLDVSFVLAAQSGLPGDTLTFTGTLTNNTGSDLFVNGAGINLTGFGPGDSDLTDFILNATGPLPNGSSIGPVDVFIVTIPDPFAAGPYTGVLAIQGGATSADDAVLGTADFEVDVNAPATTTPEPGTLLVVGGALVAALRRSRPRIAF